MRAPAVAAAAAAPAAHAALAVLVASALAVDTSVTTTTVAPNATVIGPSKILQVAVSAHGSKTVSLICRAGCRTWSTAYLGTACDTVRVDGFHAPSASSTPSTLLLGAGKYWDLLLDMTGVTATGRHYRLCIDLDGERPAFGFEDTQLLAFVTRVTGMDPPVYGTGGSLEFHLTTAEPDGGLAGATAYLGTSCDSTIRSGVVAFDATGAGTRSKSVATAGASNGVLTFVLGGVDGLDMGNVFRACVDEDGVGTALVFGDVGVSVYATGITSVEPAGVARAAGQTLTVTCFGVCSTSTRIYLTSTLCDSSLTDGDPGDVTDASASMRTTATQLDTGPAGNKWIYNVDASRLKPGQQFHMCADLDGADGLKPVGDVGLLVFISPFTEIHAIGISRAAYQKIPVSCPEGCSLATRSYIALRSITPPPPFLFEKECDMSVKNGLMGSGGNENSQSVPLVHTGGDLWTIWNIDATVLIPGRYYAICTDIDGSIMSMGFGDTGFKVYIGGLEGISPSGIRKGPAQVIQLDCPFCNPDNDITEVYLSTSCDSTHNTGVAIQSKEGQWTMSVDLPGPAGHNSRDHGDYATVYVLDASMLTIGGVYTLCHDLDGYNAKMTMGDSRFRVYVMGVLSVDPPTVQPAANQTIEFNCPDGCSDASEAYIATACDTTARLGSVTAVAGVRTASVPFSQVDNSVFSATFDASGLFVGRNYHLCTDLDGKSNVLPSGDSSLFIYATPIVASPVKTLYLDVGQEVWLTCPDVCSTDSRVYLGRHDGRYECDHGDSAGQKPATYNHTMAMMMEPKQNDAFLITFDTSHLERGLQYAICLDVDGATIQESFGNTGFKVYTAGVTDSGGTIQRETGQTLRITCANDCSTASEVYLATACDSTDLDGGILANSAHHTASVNFQATIDPSIWMATVDASKLLAGMHYKLCTDLDGASGTKPMGENLFSWYVTGVTAVSHQVLGAVRAAPLRRDTEQNVMLLCPGFCTSDTAAYLATSCDTTNFGGVAVQNGVRGTASVLLVPGLADGEWMMSVDCSGLAPGQSFRICVDLDGAVPSLSFGDAGVTAYISEVVASETQAIWRLPSQEMVLLCSGTEFCLSSAKVYLATPSEECDITRSGQKADQGDRNTEAKLASASGAVLTVTVEAGNLLFGAQYRICVDLDGDERSVVGGAEVDLHFGWTGLSVYVNPIFDFYPPSLLNQAEQQIWFICPGCRDALSGYLSSEGCDVTVFGGVMSRSGNLRTSSAFLTQDGAFWRLEFDCSSLRAGDLHSLCVDVDGVAEEVGFGDSGISVYIRGAMFFVGEPTIMAAAGQTLEISCSVGCSTNSTVYLAAECGTSDRDATVTASGSARTASSALVARPGSIAGTDWLMTYDSQDLTPGGRYSLCTDLDGANPSQPSGNSALTVYVSGVTLSGDGTVAADSGQNIDLTCASGCSADSIAYLSTSCDSNLQSGPVPPLNGIRTSSATLQGADAKWMATLDTSTLVPGAYYRLCTDLDG